MNRKFILFFFCFILFVFYHYHANSGNNESQNTYFAINNNGSYGYNRKLKRNPKRWEVLPIRSEKEYKLGKIGGEAEQHLHGIARSLYNPDYIYLSHDVTGVWRSTNAGNSWQKTHDKGLYANKGQSIEVDPVEPSILFLIADNSWNWLAKDYKGLYRSSDGGTTWKMVLHTNTNFDPKIHRIYRHNISYDLSSRKGGKILRWYAAFPNNGLYRSEDGGQRWTKRPVSYLNGHSIIYSVQTDPVDGKTVYIASSRGLLVSHSKGEQLKQVNNLPLGNVSSISICLKNSKKIYVTIKGKGLYYSNDGAKNFILMKKYDASRVFINPGHPQMIYLVGLSSNIIISHNGGKTWINNSHTLPAPGLGRNVKWKSMFAGELSGLAANPKNSSETVGFSRATIWKSTNGGITFKDSSTLFTGYSWSWTNSGIAFDSFNPERFAFFNLDVGMTITHNGGKYFKRRNEQAWFWYRKAMTSWIGTISGSFQSKKNSQIIVASIGKYFDTKLMRSVNKGRTWELIEDQDPENNLFVAFHPDAPEVVYAGNKISTNAGKTFKKLDFGRYNIHKPSVLGMCNSHADTIYAMDKRRSFILRSDNRGETWTKYAEPGWNFRKLDSKPTFSIDPVKCDDLFTIDSKGDLAVFNGKKWKSTGVLALAGGSKIGNFVRTVAIDPKHPEIIYAGMSASGIPCVWRSLDRGKNWKDITYNLPMTGMSAMAVNPHTGELFKGSTVGTWILPPPY